jgi:hypothetical protein
MMDSDLQLFRELLLLLAEHNTYWKNPRGDKLTKIYQGLMSQYVVVGNERELRSLLPSEERVRSDFSHSRRFIYLDPTEKGVPLVPLLSPKCDFGRSIPEIRLRLGLYLLDENQLIRAIGLRFESPEGPGYHHYYHAQLIKGFKKDELFYQQKGANDAQQNFDPACPPWLPVTQPALPLGIDSPVKLLLSLLVSLYGVSYVSALSVASSQKNELNRQLREMCCFSDEPIISYWRVAKPEGRPSDCLYYSTDKSEEDFRQHCGKEHPTYRLTGATEQSHEKAPKTQKKIF